MRPVPIQILFLTVLGPLLTSPKWVSAADWPCWRGPGRDGISVEAGWAWNWGTNGPRVRWRASVGKGFSSFAVASGRVYTMGNTDGIDSVFCFDTSTGKVLWQHRYTCDPQPLSYEGGPGSTPAVHASRVYSFSKEGHLFCLDAVTGMLIWSNQFALWPQRKGDWPNTWRYAGSPLLQDGRLHLSVGQAGVALDAGNGKRLWQSPDGHPGYSSPVPFADSNGKALAFFSGHAIFGVDARSGKERWQVPWNTLWDLNAADPLIHDGKMFVSSGNGVGCALFDLAASPPTELWRNKNLKTTMNTAVLWKGFLYGFNDTHLSCVAWDTGEEKWSTRDVRKGSLIIAGGKLVMLGETGKLVIAEPSAREFAPLAQAQVLEGRCWTTPVLSSGLLFVRNAAGDVVCLDLAGPST